MTQFELWLKGCEVNNTSLYCLEGEGDTGLYKTQTWKLVKRDYFGNAPVYHVWIKGECKCAITDYQTARAVWERSKHD